MSTRGRPTQKSKALRWIDRVGTVLSREGLRSLARRKLSQQLGLFGERARLWRMRGRSWRPDNRAVFLGITHRLGGGTERHLVDLERCLRDEGVRTVVVRPSARGGLLWEERDELLATTWCRESGGGREAIALMLEAISPVHAHVHHSIGLPEALFDLLAEQGLTYDWTIHDYYTICPRINLIGAGGRYCGEPEEAGCQACLGSLGDSSGRAVAEGILTWRQRNERRLAGARRVFAPSTDVCRRIERYFPGLSVMLRPHAESLRSQESLAAPLRPGEKVRVAVIGTLVAIKGSERLLACARDARARKLPLEFHVIGATDRDLELSRTGHVRVSGRYREGEVFNRLRTARPHLAFLPSECPESFMFALSIAMAARLFVVCFDLGAQAIRVRAWGFGQPIAIELEPGEINDTLIAVAAQRELAAANAPPAPEPANYPDILMSYYDFTAAERSRIVGSDFRHSQTKRPSPHIAIGRDHAHLH